MPVAQVFFTAKQISAMNIVGCLVAADGTITQDSSSAANLKTLGVFDRLELSFDPGLTQISATGADMRNYQEEALDFNASLSALDKNGKVNPVFTLAGFYSYVFITASVTPMGGTNGATSVVSFYAKTGVTRTGWLEGRNATSLDLHPCGIRPTFA